MKQGIHPAVNPVIFIDVATNDEIVSSSVLSSDETREIDGVKHFVIRCDITSFSHPFYTGEVRFVDEKGRVADFQDKVNRAQAKQAAAAGKRSTQKAADDSQAEPQSYQELLRQQQQVLRKAKPTLAA